MRRIKAIIIYVVLYGGCAENAKCDITNLQKEPAFCVCRMQALFNYVRDRLNLLCFV